MKFERRSVLLITFTAVASLGMLQAKSQTANFNNSADSSLQDRATQNATSELRFDKQIEAASQEIEQAADVPIQIDSTAGSPVVITDAKMKSVPRDTVQKLTSPQHKLDDAVTFGLLPQVTLQNTGSQPVSRLVIAYMRDGREVASMHFIAQIGPGGTHTNKGELRHALAASQRPGIMFPNGADGLTVKVRGGNFADGSSWGEPTPTYNEVGRSPGQKTRVSVGVLNKRALNKVQPAYPAEAKAQGVAGMVTVKVAIDESGKVTSAEAVSGPEELRAAAVEAAQQAQFSPLLLSGKPVSVLGTLTYNFVLQ